MGVYKTVCYKVEDIFVKLITKNEDQEEVKQKVLSFRQEKELEKARKKKEAREQAEELQRQREIQKEKEHQEVLSLLSKIVDVDSIKYTKYEFNEIKANKPFFQKLVNTVFENNEQGLTFLNCEFDKSSKAEIKGYLVVTNKRVWFVNKSLDFQQKFRYQTIKDIQWFKDGMLEKGLKVQYGVKKLEFDEIFDNEQLHRVGNIIIQQASQFR